MVQFSQQQRLTSHRPPFVPALQPRNQQLNLLCFFVHSCFYSSSYFPHRSSTN
jgi:hypothetical protein